MNSKSKTVTYQDYLKIPELLSLQHPLSKEAGELAVVRHFGFRQQRHREQQPQLTGSGNDK